MKISREQLSEYRESGWQISHRVVKTIDGKSYECLTLRDPTRTCMKVANTSMYVLAAPVVFVASLVGSVFCGVAGCLCSIVSNTSYEDGLVTSHGAAANVGRARWEESQEGLSNQSDKVCDLAIKALGMNEEFYKCVQPFEYDGTEMQVEVESIPVVIQPKSDNSHESSASLHTPLLQQI